MLNVWVRQLHFSSSLTDLSTTDFTESNWVSVCLGMKNQGLCLVFEILRSAVRSVDHAQVMDKGSPQGPSRALETGHGASSQSSAFLRLMFKHTHADPAISFEEFSPGSTPSHFGPRTWLQAARRMKEKWKRALLKCLFSLAGATERWRSSQPWLAECWFWKTDVKSLRLGPTGGKRGWIN